MTNTHQHWIDRLSDYMDMDMVEDDRAALEAHVAECAACREALADIRQIVARAHQLGDVAPSRDLWPDIAAVIAAPVKADSATVIPLPTALRAEAGPPGLFLTRPQLAAAAVILMLISATATWVAGPGIAVRQTAGMVDAAAPTSEALFASDDFEAPAGLADELQALESVLLEVGGRLDVNTLRIIETNLAVIDRAIEDSRRALAMDPESDFLEEHLARVRDRKLDYLQGVVRAVEWAG